ncbi:riboflavin biosynthesis protein RibF [Leptospira sp. GIMC2001]|uniref:riboflavin biosynthesis protein RibF n=1 Tax=Leptospira sp. GIMC2001 TaxID=1513297 RepID=UPI00234A113C|nr:riboflavin biosynthesis protein RibF [Leptospira sp. GIMC2001]WCL48800.1 riboflavin biosynthesis protein RibF [Leptospira sp. GIMC2001]
MKGFVITLGNFDGAHKGHQALFAKTLEISNKFDLPSMAISYHPNPAIVLGKKSNFTYLQSLEDRKNDILKSGLSRVEVLPFTEELASMEAEDFLETILINKFQAKHIIIGFNHCFGRERRGNFELLKKYETVYDYKVYEVEPVYSGDDKISSSLIRRFLQEGIILSANLCLGKFFNISGTVVEGRKEGRTIGFPTANILIPADLVFPGLGVYATLTNGMPSMTNVGGKPTFGDDRISIESHILNWSGDLYGQSVRLEFVEKIRDVQKFASIDDLKAQLTKDAITSHRILDN